MNKLRFPLLIFSQIRLLDLVCWHKFTFWMTNCRSRSAGHFRSQLIWIFNWLLKKSTDLDLHCLQWHDIFGFSRTPVKIYIFLFCFVFVLLFLHQNRKQRNWQGPQKFRVMGDYGKCPKILYTKVADKLTYQTLQTWTRLIRQTHLHCLPFWQVFKL